MTDRSVRVRLSLSHSDFSRGLATAAAETAAFTRSLDTSNNKMSLLLQTGIALGPSLVPVMGAVAAGGIGVAEALGATAVGAGVAVLAFQGVGDALKALNDFAIDPTSEHLQTLHEKMAVLGPDGQRFVMMLQDLRPELQQLQALAQEGLFPGVTEGLDHLLTIQPQVQSLVSNIATALGQVAAEGGEALASPFWTDFLDFIATDGRDSMLTMLEIIGQLTKASASLIMAFDPLSQDVGGALLDRTRELAKWADTLDQSQGFQGFVDFMERVGPKVWETLGAIGNALVEIVKAAAPVGEITLPVLTALADAIAAIAASPAGPVLIGVAVAINALSRAMALWNVVSGGGAIGTMLLGPALGKDATQAQVLTRYAAMLRVAAGAAAAFALSMTDVDDKLGVSNTLMFGAIGGTVGGGPGAAAGLLIGSLFDLKAANEDVASSFEDLSASMLSLDDVEFARRVDAIQGKIDELARQQFMAQGAGGSLLNRVLPDNVIGGALGGPLSSLFGDNAADEQQAQLDALQRQRDAVMRTAASQQAAFQFRTTPMPAFDSRAGRANELIGSVQALDNQLISTTSSAEALSNALDELLNPTMNLEAATDAYTTALRHWEGELNDSNKTLKGNSDAAIQNRTAIRGRVDLLKQQLAAEANAGWGAERLTNSMQRQRGALLDSAKAAGLNRKEVQELINTYGLTPRLIETLIRANTESAMQNISKLKAYLASLHDKTINITTIQNTATSQQSAHDFRQGGGAYGGQVFGPGGPRDDQVPRMLSNREWVQPVDAVDYYGPGFMSAVQHKTFPRMADGGSVAWFADGMPRGSRAPMSYGFRTSVPGDAARGSLRISGELTFGEDGRAYIRGVAREALDGDADFAASAARQRGGR